MKPCKPMSQRRTSSCLDGSGAGDRLSPRSGDMMRCVNKHRATVMTSVLAVTEGSS